MEKKKTELSRRDFAKLIAGAGAAVTVAPFGRADASPKEVEKASREIREQFTMPEGASPIKVNDKLKRFNEGNMTFYHESSSIVKNYKGEDRYWMEAKIDEKERLISKSQHGLDIPASSVAAARTARSIEAAGWTLLNTLGYGEPNRNMHKWDHLPSEKAWRNVYEKAPDETDPKNLTNSVKYMARLSGADLVGCAPLNRNWMFSHVHTTKDDTPGSRDYIIKPMNFRDIERPTETEEEYQIPYSMNNVIVSAFAMNREMIQTAPATLANAATAFGYSRMIAHDMWMCAFIRNQGYYAIPSCNGVGQSVPLAVEAGLGQASRMGLLITPEYGPMVRLSKIFTNMPLVYDKPIDFGVTEFCETCKKCARDCPSKAISEGPMSYEARDVHNQEGKLQWVNDHKKCMNFWIKSGGSCAICIAACPFSKGNIWIHDGVEWLIDNTRFLDPFMLGMDEALGYGARRDVEEVLNGKINTYGLDTDHFQDTESTLKDRVKS